MSAAPRQRPPTAGDNMKYAAIADIHGNYSALRAVLEDAGKRGITHFLFAGDYCISGSRPDECIDAIRAIPEKTVIRGNEEQYLENLIGKDQALWTDGQMQVSYWTYRNMRRENLEYVLALPHRAETGYGGIRIRMAHSSVDFMGTYPFYTWNSVTVADRIRLKGADPEKVAAEINAERCRDPAFRETAAGLEKGVYVFGHSHIQWSYADRDRGVYLVNPGSCGIPLDGIREGVPYTVLEITKSGQVSIEELRVPFDREAYTGELLRSGQCREARVWSLLIAREVASAREHIYYFLAFAEQYAKETGDERRPYATDTWEKAYETWIRKQETEKNPEK